MNASPTRRKARREVVSPNRKSNSQSSSRRVKRKEVNSNNSSNHRSKKRRSLKRRSLKSLSSHLERVVNAAKRTKKVVLLTLSKPSLSATPVILSSLAVTK